MPDLLNFLNESWTPFHATGDFQMCTFVSLIHVPVCQCMSVYTHWREVKSQWVVVAASHFMHDEGDELWGSQS